MWRMCHPLNPGIDSEIHADPSASYSVMAWGREHMIVSDRFGMCGFVGILFVRNSCIIIQEVYVDLIWVYVETLESILNLINNLHSPQFVSATTGK